MSEELAYHKHTHCLTGVKHPPRPGRWRAHTHTHAHVQCDCCVWSYYTLLWCEPFSPCSHRQENKEPAAVTERGRAGLSAAQSTRRPPPGRTSVVCGVISSVVLLPLCRLSPGPFFALPTRVLTFRVQPTRCCLSAGL